MIFKESKAKFVSILLGILFLVMVGLWGAVFGGVSSNETALYFLSVGQGDSSFIQLPATGGRAGGAQILIDGGPSGKALLENLSKVMPAEDRYIDLVIMSHPQLDHFAGFIDLLKKYDVGAFIGSGRRGEVAAYKELHAQIEKRGVPYIALKEGDGISVGDVKLSILSPSPSGLMSGELNDTTLVVLLEAKDIKALYTGDIDAHTEEELVSRYALDVDVLKVAHHGSRFSSSDKFLEKISPSVAVIEVGKNTYGHPTKAALERLAKYAQKVFRTDEQGIVKVVASADALSVFNLTY